MFDYIISYDITEILLKVALNTITTNYTVKWFFSSDDGRCKRFWYGGCEGNQNKFDSEADCNSGCRRSVTPEGR
jgi:hypothetical protein